MITSRYPPLLFFPLQIYNANTLQRLRVCVYECVMHKPFATNYSLLKNEHPWALREGKQGEIGNKQEERGGDEE